MDLVKLVLSAPAKRLSSSPDNVETSKKQKLIQVESSDPLPSSKLKYLTATYIQPAPIKTSKKPKKVTPTSDRALRNRAQFKYEFVPWFNKQPTQEKTQPKSKKQHILKPSKPIKSEDLTQYEYDGTLISMCRNS